MTAAANAPTMTSMTISTGAMRMRGALTTTTTQPASRRSGVR